MATSSDDSEGTRGGGHGGQRGRSGDDADRSFWTTLAGVLTAVAGLIGAVGGLLLVLFQVGVLGGDDAPNPVFERLEAETAIAVENERIVARSEASGARTVLVLAGETLTADLGLRDSVSCEFTVRYSNDNFGDLERVELAVDGEPVGRFDTRDTGGTGEGWNVFETSEPMGPATLRSGSHLVELAVVGGDGRGIEVDQIEATCA